MADAVNLVHTKMDMLQRNLEVGTFRDLDFVKVTTVLNDDENLKEDPSYKREAEAVSVSFNASTYKWDSTSTYIYKDADLESSEKKTVFYRSNISSENELELDKVYLVASYTNATETSDWVVIETGGGGSSPLVLLKSTSPSEVNGEYLADIIADPIGQSVITSNVTVKAPQLKFGTLPLGGSEVTSIWRAAETSNYADPNKVANAAGGNPPSTIYEIYPAVWY